MITATSILAALLVPSGPEAQSTPMPSPVIMSVASDRAKEIVRIVFLGFDIDHAPRAPKTVFGTLYNRGRALSVAMHRKWQGLGAVPEGWVPADYVLDLPKGTSGGAVLSLSSRKDGYSFQLNQ